MTLASLKKTQANRVLGIDASTNSIAFCLMENDVPLKWGKINLAGNDIYEKIYDAKLKMALMLDELKSDYIGDPNGFCALWCIWWTDIRLSNPNIPREKLVKMLMNIE